ncbi:hypothetical protein Gpo141_00009088 [Globisporangium polare]
MELSQARERAIEVKSFQFEQMKAKQQLKKEHKLDEKVLMEHLEWEQAQLAIADQDRQEYLLWKRGQMREAHLGAMELERRRNTVTAMSKSFFDKLTILSAPQAMEVFLEKREQLLECCMHQFRDHVDPSELESIQSEVEEMIEKAHGDLKYRMRSHQREEFMKAEKKRALLNLKKSHLEQIQQHLSNSSDRHAEEAAIRKEIVRDQDALDRRYQAREVARKQQTLAHNAKIVQQIRNNEDARATLSISVQGSCSLYRTPWWSDESEERLKIYDKPTPEKTSDDTFQQQQHHIVHGKKSCRWYD